MSKKQGFAVMSGLIMVMMVVLAGCQLFDQDSVTAPGSASDLANFYSCRGLGTGEIGGYVKAGEFVLNLPAGHWRVTYTMPDGNEYTKYVVLDQESLCHFGTHSDTVVQVEVEQGEFTDDGSSMSLSNAQRLFSSGSFRGQGVIVFVIVNGQVNTAGSSGIAVVLIPQEAAYPRVPPNVAGIWRLVMSGISNEYHDGTLYASSPWEADITLPKITQIGGTISTSWTNDEGKLNTLTGTITGNSIYFTLQTGVTDYWYFNGIINGSAISGTYSGISSDDDPSCFPGGWCGIPTYQDSGTFRVTITP